MVDYDAGMYIEGATSHNDQDISDYACELFELYNYYEEHFNDQEFIIDFDEDFEKPQDVSMKLDQPN